jgi:hypothetical protein
MMPARKLKRGWDPSQEPADFHHFVWPMLWGVFLVVVALLLPASCAHSAEIAPSEPTPAERLGPQFLYGWSQRDMSALRSAFAKMEDEHLAHPDGFDKYLMARRARILNKLASGFLFYDENWKEMHLTMVGPYDEPWWIVHMTLPETILTGVVASRDRYCRAEDQDTEDMFEAGAYCAEHNDAANELFRLIERTKHATPGGKQ